MKVVGSTLTLELTLAEFLALKTLLGNYPLKQLTLEEQKELDALYAGMCSIVVRGE